MKAFPNTLITRDLMISDMIAHREADRLIAGQYGSAGDDFKGCGIGCSIHAINRVIGSRHKHNDHAALAEETGIPKLLYHLQDRIFEGLGAADRVFWPQRFYQSIPDGSDQSDTARRICIRILREMVVPIATERWGVLAAVTGVADALESQDPEIIVIAEKAASTAAGTAPHDTYTTALAAAYAAAARATALAAAYAAAFAVDAAAYATADAVADAAAYAAARAAAWSRIADIVCQEMAKSV